MVDAVEVKEVVFDELQEEEKRDAAEEENKNLNRDGIRKTWVIECSRHPYNPCQYVIKQKILKNGDHNEFLTTGPLSRAEGVKKIEFDEDEKVGRLNDTNPFEALTLLNTDATLQNYCKWFEACDRRCTCGQGFSWCRMLSLCVAPGLLFLAPMIVYVEHPAVGLVMIFLFMYIINCGIFIMMMRKVKKYRFSARFRSLSEYSALLGSKQHKRLQFVTTTMGMTVMLASATELGEDNPTYIIIQMYSGFWLLFAGFFPALTKGLRFSQEHNNNIRSENTHNVESPIKFPFAAGVSSAMHTCGIILYLLSNMVAQGLYIMEDCDTEVLVTGWWVEAALLIFTAVVYSGAKRARPRGKTVGDAMWSCEGYCCNACPHRLWTVHECFWWTTLLEATCILFITLGTLFLSAARNPQFDWLPNRCPL